MKKKNSVIYVHFSRRQLLLLMSALFTLCSHATLVDSTRIALKTNALLWTTASPNLGVEVALGPQWTFDAAASINPFTFANNRKWKHWQVTLEPRYWFDHRFDGHFLGAHLGGGEFNIGRVDVPFTVFKKEYRYEGWHLRGGVSYGYRWNFGRGWGLEALLGLGLVYADYNQFECAVCGKLRDSTSKLFFAPTRLGLTLVYTFGSRAKESPTIAEYRDTVVEYRDRIVEKPVVAATLTAAERLEQKYPFLTHEGDSVTSHEGVSVRFRLDMSDVDADYLDNRSELARLLECIHEMEAEQALDLTGITIIGYASPEGERQHNETLAANRAEALRQYIAAEAGICDCKIVASSGGEDWEGLRQLVEQSDMRMKEEVLRIIDTTSADMRKQRLQQLDGGRPWQSIRDVLSPQLRSACYINVWYTENKETNRR